MTSIVRMHPPPNIDITLGLYYYYNNYLILDSIIVFT